MNSKLLHYRLLLSYSLCFTLTLVSCDSLPISIPGVSPSDGGASSTTSSSSPLNTPSSSIPSSAPPNQKIQVNSIPADCPPDFSVANVNALPEGIFRTLAEGSSCDSILANGAFDTLTRSSTTDLSKISSLDQESQKRIAQVDNLCQSDLKASSSSNAVAANGKYGVPALSVEGGFSVDTKQAETIQKSMCQGYQKSEENSDKLARYDKITNADAQFLDQKMASPIILDAWSACIAKTEESRIGISSSITEDANGNIFFKAKWNANFGVPSVQIKNFYVSGAAIPEGQQVMNRCSRLTTAEQIQVLKRTSKGNVTIVMNTSAGSISRTLVNTNYRPPVINVNTENISLKTGEIRVIDATVSYSNAPTDQDIVWSSSNPQVVKVSENGQIEALMSGNAVLTLKAKKELSVSREITINVNEANKITNVKILPPASSELSPNASKSLSVAVTHSDGLVSNNDVDWSSSDPLVATVDSTGKVTAITTGDVTLTATASKDFSQKDSLVLYVKNPVVKPVVKSVQIFTLPFEIVIGKAVPLSVEVLMSDGTKTSAVLWESNNPAVASVDAKGLVAGLNKGSATLTATASEDPSQKTSVNIIVTPVASIKLLGNSSSLLNPGQSLQLAAEVLMFNGATTQDVIWESSSPDNISVDQNGLLKLRYPGKCSEISVKAKADETKLDTKYFCSNKR